MLSICVYASLQSYYEGLRAWFSIFIFIETLKIISYFNAYRFIRNADHLIANIPLKCRVAFFAIESISFAWILYGNILFYANSHLQKDGKINMKLL